MDKKINVVFLGTPDFSVPTLELLHRHPLVNLVQVITMPDRPAGRGQRLTAPPVAIFAKEKQIPLFQTANINREELFLNELAGKNIDVIIVLAFAQFLSNKVLNLPKIASFNIHTSLLPKYRGAAPIQHALLNGDRSTGVSIQKMVKQMDAGDLAYSHAVDISEDETAETLFEKLKHEAVSACDNFIKILCENKIEYQAQDPSQVTYAPPILKNDGHVDFQKKTMREISSMLKAYYPWPTIFCFLDNTRLKIFKVAQEKLKLIPGELSFDYGTFLVGCLDGTLRLCEIQSEGKKISSDIDFISSLKNRYHNDLSKIQLTPMVLNL